MKDTKKTIRDLEDVRNSSEEVRSFRHVHGHIKGAEDYSKHPEGCTCGHCGKDHNHSSMGHVPKHSHGDGCSHTHEHEQAEHDRVLETRGDKRHELGVYLAATAQHKPQNDERDYANDCRRPAIAIERYAEHAHRQHKREVLTLEMTVGVGLIDRPYHA